MEQIAGSIIAQWGAVGLILVLAAYIIIDGIKRNKSQNTSNTKLDSIIDDINEVKTTVPAIQQQMEVLDTKIGIVNQKVDEKIDFYVDHLSSRMDKLESKVDSQPQNILESLANRDQAIQDEHNKRMLDQIKRAPKIHKELGRYLGRIGCDHIFIGSFHNGTTSISGVPYYKFDIVAEKYDPENIARDREFAHMYKDVDILRHDKLPIALTQNGMVHYVINEDKTSDLKDIDDIVYRRMIGRDIKQLALHVLRDQAGIPTGFVGCVKYDYTELDFNELKGCATALEEIYK